MSPAYRLTSGAESDIREILQYTLEKWGAEQASKYAAILDRTIEKLAIGKLNGRKFSEKLPGIRVYRCEHHYIFFKSCSPVLVLAILHERMHLTHRLRERLEGS
jgi:plasmid stabilization system protein ParE